MSPDAYLPRKNRYDSFPWQVQAYRAGRWCVISCHVSEARADKGLAQIRKCTPSFSEPVSQGFLRVGRLYLGQSG